MTDTIKHKPDRELLPDGDGGFRCTCGADKPTPPAPADAEVREARGQLEGQIKNMSPNCWAFAVKPETIRTILAALDKALGEVVAQVGRIAALEGHVSDYKLCNTISHSAASQWKDKAEAAEAELSLVTEWARGRCECCGETSCEHHDKPRIETACGQWTPAWAKGEQ
jgi:hypothetical protein